MEKCLEGIRVIDFTVALAGPYSTVLLSDMGAEVIKIENSIPAPPGAGNRLGNPNIAGTSLFFANANHGKKAVTINMKTEKGKEILTKLIKTADIFVENNRPGVIGRLGFSYDEVKKIKPDIIYASGSGFGQTGSYWKYPGYDIVGQAMGGGMSVTGFPGDPQPQNPFPSFCDVSVSENLANAILAALLRRNKTGEGAYIEASLVDSMVTNQAYMIPYAIWGEEPGQIGNRIDRIGGPADGYFSSDGYFVIMCETQSDWESLAKAMGKPELIEDPRFLTPADRLNSARNGDPLKAIIDDWAKDQTTKEILKCLFAADVPAYEVYDYEKMAADHHIRDGRFMFRDVPADTGESVRITGNPIKMDKYPCDPLRAVSSFGADNDAIFGQLGYSPEDLSVLRTEGIIS